MPVTQYYDTKNDVVVEGIRIDPSEPSKVIEEFCPDLRWDQVNGIDFLPDGRRQQHYPNMPFFTIGRNRNGNLFDYLMNLSGGFVIFSETEFRNRFTSA